MSRQFSTTRTVEGKLLVQGSDPGEQAVLNPATWDEAKLRKTSVEVTAEYQKKASEVADADPLVVAMKEARAKIEAATPKASDDQKVVISEGKAGVRPEVGEVVYLDHDGLVAKLIEEGQTNRLVWVVALEGSQKIQVTQR